MSEHAPPGADVTVPSPARMYGCFLGGGENYESDREAVEAVRAAMPDLEDAAGANRLRGAEDPCAADTDGSRWGYCAVARKTE